MKIAFKQPVCYCEQISRHVWRASVSCFTFCKNVNMNMPWIANFVEWLTRMSLCSKAAPKNVARCQSQARLSLFTSREAARSKVTVGLGKTLFKTFYFFVMVISFNMSFKVAVILVLSFQSFPLVSINFHYYFQLFSIISHYFALRLLTKSCTSTRLQRLIVCKTWFYLLFN